MARCALCSLTLVACGYSDDGNAIAGSSSTADKSAVVALSTQPIPFRDLYDSRDGKPLIQTETVQLEVCPLLSLKTLADWSGFSERPKLELATTDRCEFSKGAAFGFSIRVESAANVDVNNHSGRAYNMDIEPVVEAQAGPGEKAVMLIDTAFVDNGLEPFRYAYFFVLGDKAITLWSRAFKIKEGGWRSMAEEVAANIQSGLAGEKAQTIEVVENDAYTIEPCGFITHDQLAMLTEWSSADISSNHKPVRSTCGWKFPDGSVLNFRFRAARATYPDSNQEDRADSLGMFARGSTFVY